MGHGIADELSEAHHTTVWCECGKSWQHPERAGAVKRWEGHVFIQEARRELEGGRG